MSRPDTDRWASAGSPLCLLLLLLQPACSRSEPAMTGQATEPAAAASNRIPLPPAVVQNLGITFAQATRGKLGRWREVPGQLEVPENRRWTLHAPADARLISVAARWQRVDAGSEVAVLASPALPGARRAIEYAQRTLERTTTEVLAARSRLAESETHLREARAFETASRQRLAEVEQLSAGGNALSRAELIEARRTVTAAGKASLDAALARDQLVSRVAIVELEADQARQTVGERLEALAVLTGQSVAELTRADAGGGAPAWEQLETLALRAPLTGIVVELFAGPGETLEQGDAILQAFDTRELRFRGHLPEGDLGALATGSRVRLEFPARRLAPIETVLEPPVPVSDPGTRMIHVDAVVPNENGLLAHGLSVMAQVLERESAADEVLMPARCIVFDGLEAIVFKRDPQASDVVIRTPVELGARGAGLVEVLAGVLDGDELVADGVHQLKQTGLGKPPEGGHFHADGTFHEDHD